MTFRVSPNGTDVPGGKKFVKRDTFLGVDRQANHIHARYLHLHTILIKCGNDIKWEFPKTNKKNIGDVGAKDTFEYEKRVRRSQVVTSDG